MLVERLPGRFGVAVEGVDLRAAEALFSELTRLLYEHHVLLIRGQALSRKEFAAFARMWGTPQVRYGSASYHHALDADETPDVIQLSNSPETPEKFRDNARHWHSDGTYDLMPSNVTLLYALEAPEVGGETLFTDMTAAYAALPEATRTRIEDLRARHFILAGKVDEDEHIVRDMFTEEEKAALYERVTHPLVYRHPKTGRRSLFGVAATATGVVSMDPEDSERLLDELKRHAVSEAFRTSVKASTGDLLMWDNYAVMHCATPLEYSAEAGKRRRLLRVSTKGEMTPLVAEPVS